MVYPATLYELGQFVSSNPGCPITTVTVEPISVGPASDFENEDGDLITMTHDSTGISVTVPSSDVYEETFKFWLKA